MTPADIDRVFGRGRLKMATGEHVEVFREESQPGERRRYTKRFLSSMGGDFRQWTEREWRILARLVGHGIGPVPDVVQFDRGDASRPALVQMRRDHQRRQPLAEARFHLAAQPHRGRVGIHRDVAPAHRLPGGDRPQHLPAVRETKRQATLCRGIGGGHETPDHRVAALAVQQLARL